MLKLEAFCSAKLCLKDGIEDGPMTANGHKKAILDHFSCLMRVLSAKNGFFVKKYIKIIGKTISTILALTSYFCDFKWFKIASFGIMTHFSYIFGKILSKSRRRFDEVKTSPRLPDRSF